MMSSAPRSFRRRGAARPSSCRAAAATLPARARASRWSGSSTEEMACSTRRLSVSWIRRQNRDELRLHRLRVLIGYLARSRRFMAAAAVAEADRADIDH